jgi:uncharacterized membrane protein
MFILFGVLLVIALFVGTVLSFVNHVKISSLKSELQKLNTALKLQRVQINRLLANKDSFNDPPTDSSKGVDEKASVDNDTDEQESIEITPVTPRLEDAPTVQLNNQGKSDKLTPLKTKSALSNNAPKSASAPKKAAFSLETLLMGNGLLWLGAAVLALGGVFLAKYSIEAGLFPPQLRIIAGVCFGLGLITLAEYLYRHPKRFQINSSMISAALASGGLITCFSMTLVAFDFYAFLSPALAFVILALISIVATWLSVRFGPILALIGVVGAYVVPALISTGSNNVLSLLLYVAFVSVSSLWVHAIVKQSWLWWLSVLGHFGWLFISLLIAEDSYDWVIFSYCIVSIYLFVLVPITGWKFDHSAFAPLPIKSLLMPRKEQLGIALPVVALVLLFLSRAYEPDILVMLPLFSALLLIIPFRHSAFDTWPFIALLLCILTFLKIPVLYDYSDNLFPFTAGYLLAQVASALFIVYSLFAIFILKNRPSYLLLLVLAPISLMGISYALSTPQASTYLYSVWSVELMIIALTFALLSVKTSTVLHKMTFLMLANGAFTLTLTMLLSASTLTVAIIAQITLMAYLSRKYHLLMPNWLYKVAIAAVMLRLSCAPWLSAYMGETVIGINWSLVVYPAAFALLWLARLYQTNEALKAWFTGALLHLVALFVTTETSYLIVGNYPNLFDLTYHQSILLSMNWLILSAVYLWRKQSTSLKRLYTFFSLLLFTASAALQTYLSVLQNPFVTLQDTGPGIIVNWLFPLWLVPSAVLLGMLFWGLVLPKLRLLVYGVSSLFAAFYINGIIRGIYQPALSFANFDVDQQELYVYSIVWLVISICLIVLSQLYKNENFNKIGFGVLALVILKAFIIDLSSLEGLYRALSFMGLGLSLVGIGWLFQRFKNKDTGADNDAPLVEN